MPSVFDVVLSQADKAIESVMMSDFVIEGVTYKAVYDESPKDFESLNGVLRTLTLYQSQGYTPRKNDIVEIGEQEYIVASYIFNDGLIVLTLEEDGRY